MNKHDINGDNSRNIETYCSNQGIEVASKIPFDNVVTEAMVLGLPVVAYSDSEVSYEIEQLWRNISSQLAKS